MTQDKKHGKDFYYFIEFMTEDNVTILLHQECAISEEEVLESIACTFGWNNPIDPTIPSTLFMPEDDDKTNDEALEILAKDYLTVIDADPLGKPDLKKMLSQDTHYHFLIIGKENSVSIHDTLLLVYEIKGKKSKLLYQTTISKLSHIG